MQLGEEFNGLAPRFQLLGFAAQGWVTVHLDDRYFIMVRQPVAAARQWPVYQVISPWDNVRVTPANARQVLEEANRALSQCPAAATFTWAYKANALRLLGRHDEALEAGLKIPEQLVIQYD
jgi:hypothetical protein